MGAVGRLVRRGDHAAVIGEADHGVASAQRVGGVQRAQLAHQGRHVASNQYVLVPNERGGAVGELVDSPAEGCDVRRAALQALLLELHRRTETINVAGHDGGHLLAGAEDVGHELIAVGSDEFGGG